MSADQRYPLSWPAGWSRTSGRTAARFSKSRNVYRQDGTLAYKTAARLEVGDGLRRLEGELGRLGASAVVISSNLRRNLDGSITANQSKMLADPGIAVYFKLKGKPRVLACDKWASAAENMAAIAGHIEAIRAVDRYGVGTLDQAFAGYQALPSAAGSWFVVLEFAEPPKEWGVIEERVKRLRLLHHPDRGGNPDTMAKINAAFDTARSEFGK